MKIQTIYFKLTKLEDEIKQIEGYCEYPYKQGYMKCINSRTNTWAITAKATKMLNSRYKKVHELENKLIDLINDIGREKVKYVLVKECGLDPIIAEDNIDYLTQEW